MPTNCSVCKDPGDEPSRPCLILCKLSESRYAVGNLGWVVCRLWRMDTSLGGSPSSYAIELRGMGSCILRLIGGDKVRARRVFALVVRHTVTPCALRDVLEELD